MPNGFVYVERPWGALFFKHLGQKTKNQGQKDCLNAGNTHLPIPRSREENEFFRTHFGKKNLWLDISKASNSFNYKDSNNTIFSSIIKTTDDVIQIDKYDWVKFNLTKSERETAFSFNVEMLENGQYDIVNSWSNRKNEAVCVYNTISQQKCTECLPGFCQYTNNEYNETKCVCPKTSRGENCEIDLCSHCQNGGTCRIKDGTNETECICPRPFDGDFCEIDLSNLNFTLIEKPWGSILYKYLGKQRKDRANYLCSKFGYSSHLPRPRFPEENDFYRTYFGNVSLWIEVPEIMISFVRTKTDNVVINNFDWINLNISDKSHLTEIILTETGRWERAKPNLMMNTICVKDIQPDQNCTRCADDAFCRYTSLERNETSCFCPAHKQGLDCEIDLCSICQNNGLCMISETNQVECICPHPFDGIHCEINLCPHCQNGAYCTVSARQLLTNLTNLTNFTNLTNSENPTNLTDLMNNDNLTNMINKTNLTNLSESECICADSFRGKYCEESKLIKILQKRFGTKRKGSLHFLRRKLRKRERMIASY